MRGGLLYNNTGKGVTMTLTQVMKLLEESYDVDILQAWDEENEKIVWYGIKDPVADVMMELAIDSYDDKGSDESQVIALTHALLSLSNTIRSVVQDIEIIGKAITGGEDET